MKFFGQRVNDACWHAVSCKLDALILEERPLLDTNPETHSAALLAAMLQGISEMGIDCRLGMSRLARYARASNSRVATTYPAPRHGRLLPRTTCYGKSRIGSCRGWTVSPVGATFKNYRCTMRWFKQYVTEPRSHKTVTIVTPEISVAVATEVSMTLSVELNCIGFYH
jgi:hypothetical protein